MKIAIGVVLYYPLKEDIKRIEDYGLFFDKVYIIDNTDSEHTNSKIFDEYTGGKFEYFSNGENLGIAKALNLICEKAKKANFTHVITMDQDSIFKRKDIDKFLYFLKNKINWENIAIAAPNIIYNLSDNDTQQIKSKNISTEIEEVDWVITSASCVNLQLFSIIGNFEEKYFIDRVDEEYCYRIRSKGFKILKIKCSNLYQQLGENGKIKIINYSEHSAIRNYYIARNRLYFYNAKYKNKIKRLFICFIMTVKQSLYVVMFDKKNKLEKVKYIIKGVKDYHIKKEGKLLE